MRIIIMFFISNIFFIYANDFVYVKKGEVAKSEGFIVDKDTLTVLMNIDKENEILKENIELYKKKVYSLESEILLLNEKIKFLDLKDRINKEYQKELEMINNYNKKLYIYKDLFYVFLGISIAEMLGFGFYILGNYMAGGLK